MRLLDDIEVVVPARHSFAMRGDILRSRHEGVDVLLLAALGPILAMWWSCRVSVESRKVKVLSASEFGSLWLRSLMPGRRANQVVCWWKEPWC